MTSETLNLEGTAVLERLFPGLEMNPSVSPLLAEARAPGELFADFFASTNVHSVPSGTSWLINSLGEVSWSTSLLAETPIAIPLRWYSSHEAEEEQESQQARPHPAFVKANADRVELLARKYVAKERFPDEQSARLAILTERVRKLIPAVTAEEYEALEHRLKDVQELSALNIKLRERLAKAKVSGG
jgi:hypothetical protein